MLLRKILINGVFSSTCGDREKKIAIYWGTGKHVYGVLLPITAIINALQVGGGRILLGLFCSIHLGLLFSNQCYKCMIRSWFGNPVEKWDSFLIQPQSLTPSFTSYSPTSGRYCTTVVTMPSERFASIRPKIKSMVVVRSLLLVHINEGFFVLVTWLVCAFWTSTQNSFVIKPKKLAP